MPTRALVVVLLLRADYHVLYCHQLGLANNASGNNGSVHLPFPTCNRNLVKGLLDSNGAALHD